MDEEITLARKEEVRLSMLLCSSGDGGNGEESPRGDTGQEVSGHAKGDEREEETNYSAQGQSHAASAGGDGKGRVRHRHSYKARRTVGEVEGGNVSTGRSAKELGIKWIGSRCDDSPSGAHYSIGVSMIDGGTVFRCIYCERVQWLPNSTEESRRFDTWISKYGLNKAYQMLLDAHPTAMHLISKIQDIRYLRKITPLEQFPMVVAAVMKDSDYPYEVKENETV